MKDIKTIYGNRIRLRACGILTGENDILLVRHKGLGESGELWSFPGGGVEFGEDMKKALKREFLEETGLHITVGTFRFAYEYINEPLHAVEIYFNVTRTGGTLVTGYDPEMYASEQHLTEARFVTFDELRVMDASVKHEILRHADSRDALNNLEGYFKF